MLPRENPSRTVHAVCAYWLMSSDGLTARAGWYWASSVHATARPSTTTVRACRFSFCIEPHGTRPGLQRVRERQRAGEVIPRYPTVRCVEIPTRVLDCATRGSLVFERASCYGHT